MSKLNPNREKNFYANIILKGAGGHSSTPYKTHNPINAGFVLIQMIQNRVWFEFDGYDNVKFNPVSIDGGAKENIIPDTATVQYYGECVTEDQYEKLKQILDSTLKAIQVTYQIDYQLNYETA